MKKLAILYILSILTLQAQSQNIPLGTLPMLYNGGFAGQAQHGRLNAGANIYSPKFSNAPGTGIHRSYFTSYDQFIKKLSTGIGVTFIENTTYHGQIDILHNNKVYSVGRLPNPCKYSYCSVSPKFSFKGKFTLAPFFNFIYTDIGSRVPGAPDSLAGPDGAKFPSGSPRRHHFSESFGFLFNSKRFYTD